MKTHTTYTIDWFYYKKHTKVRDAHGKLLKKNKVKVIEKQ